MLKAIFALALVLFLGTTAVPGAASPPTKFLGWYKVPLLQQTVHLGDLTATIIVTQTFDSVLVTSQWWSTPKSTFHITCLSAYRDLRYELRDTGGHIIPINQATIEHPPKHYEGFLNHVNGQPPPPCTAQVGHRMQTSAAVGEFYPGLPWGTYTLQITVAPRGTTQQAAIAPVQFTLKKVPAH